VPELEAEPCHHVLRYGNIYLILPSWRGAKATRNKHICLQVKFRCGPVKQINKCLVKIWAPVVEGRVLVLCIRYIPLVNLRLNTEYRDRRFSSPRYYQVPQLILDNLIIRDYSTCHA
jgi:hypothetical protein